jgi:hypothetical protein
MMMISRRLDHFSTAENEGPYLQTYGLERTEHGALVGFL